MVSIALYALGLQCLQWDSLKRGSIRGDKGVDMPLWARFMRRLRQLRRSACVFDMYKSILGAVEYFANVT